MLKLIVAGLFLLFSAGAADNTQVRDKTQVSSERESDLAKAVEKQEQRHFEIHQDYIPLTQGNLQWLAAAVRAKPDEILVVWKLMRQWDGVRAVARRATS